jgi:hypothetical protein
MSDDNERQAGAAPRGAVGAGGSAPSYAQLAAYAAAVGMRIEVGVKLTPTVEK